jgi:hypothetical protein
VHGLEASCRRFAGARAELDCPDRPPGASTASVRFPGEWRRTSAIVRSGLYAAVMAGSSRRLTEEVRNLTLVHGSGLKQMAIFEAADYAVAALRRADFGCAKASMG